MKIFLYVFTFFFSTSVLAHPGHADTFMNAILHPFLGFMLERVVLIAMVLLPIVHFLIQRLSSWVVFSVISLIGSIHGFTHGLEINVYSNFSILGLVLSTAAIHTMGYISGNYLKNNHEWILKSLTVTTGLLGAIGLIQTF